VGPRLHGRLVGRLRADQFIARDFGQLDDDISALMAMTGSYV